jgi:hypothetical protein
MFDRRQVLEMGCSCFSRSILANGSCNASRTFPSLWAALGRNFDVTKGLAELWRSYGVLCRSSRTFGADVRLTSPGGDLCVSSQQSPGSRARVVVRMQFMDGTGHQSPGLYHSPEEQGSTLSPSACFSILVGRRGISRGGIDVEN